ncbi:MAG: SurA N-terminal domain-containing protein [Rhizobiales bacterium]|nr:SurA N-terminal domain-containing protein [Hyphomicrobiales bacterium]
MLRGMRKASSNWLGKSVMVVMFSVLIVSFGIWGIADVFKGSGRTDVATVGDATISTDQFRNIYTDRLQQFGRQFGRPLTSEQARAFGLDRQVLQQVLAESALDQQTKKMSLGLSDQDIARAIADDPNFKGLDGKFDRARFDAIIRNFGYNEQKYIAEQRRVSLRRQITGTITTGLEPTKTQMEALVRFQNEQRSVQYLTLTAAQAGKIDPPSPEALAAYFDERKQLFRAPEYRKIAILTLTPDEMAKAITVSDDDAKKEYDQKREKYVTPEKRQVLQITFPSEDEAKAARAKMDSGTSFEDLAKQRDLKPADIDLGTVTKASLGDPAFADVAFALPLNGVSQPVKGALSTALLKVTKIEAGNTPTFESLSAKIKTELAQQRARDQLRDLHNKIEDERGGGANIAEAAKKLGLGAVTIEAVDRSGRAPDGQPVKGLPSGVDIVSQAFASNIGVENDSIQNNGGEIWYDVLGITPSRDRPLDEVKAQAEQRWMDDQVATRLRAKATEIVDKLNKGGKLDTEATAAGVKVQTAGPFKRDADVKGVPDRLVNAAFRTPKDGIGQTEGSGPSDQIVFRVTDIVVPAIDMSSEDAKKLKDNLIRAMTEEQVQQYVGKVESELGTKINPSAFAVATGAAASQ